nr:lateral organ boundaries domain protein 14 [Ipomoea batatas]
MMSSSSNKNSMPCAACKLLRRRCTKYCIFLPYFPPTHPERFAAVHQVFGASNITKMLQEVPVDSRADAVMSMVYEATARLRDPIYGCVGLISLLQKNVFELQSKLNESVAETMALKTQLSNVLSASLLYDPALPDTMLLTSDLSNSSQPTEFLNPEPYIV